MGSQGTEWGKKACSLQTALVALGSEPEPSVGAPDTQATPPHGVQHVVMSMWAPLAAGTGCRGQLQGPAAVPWGGTAEDAVPALELMRAPSVSRLTAKPLCFQTSGKAGEG